jgi:hypothetical protein
MTDLRRRDEVLSFLQNVRRILSRFDSAAAASTKRVPQSYYYLGYLECALSISYSSQRYIAHFSGSVLGVCSKRVRTRMAFNENARAHS